MDEALREERSRWRERAAPWTENAPRLAEAADRFNRPLIEAAGIAAGEQVLDLASGAGEPALSLGAEVGPTGTVTALDLSAEMLSGLRRRAAAAGLAIRLAAGDMSRLPFVERRFDRVTCRFGLMFPADPAVALGEMRRVLKPGGTVAVMVWGPLADNTLFAAIEAAAATAGLRSDGPDSVRFRLAAPGRLAALLAGAGFAEPRERALQFERRPRLEADPPFWQSQTRMTCTERLAPATGEQRDRFARALRDEFARRADADGRVPLAFHARIGLGGAP